MEISKYEARKIFLRQQGLLNNEFFGRGTNAALEAIRRLSYLQIDTISVVSRSHDHILKSRIRNLNQATLEKLMLNRSIYEHWSHAAAYLPFENFRYSLPLMQGYRTSRSVDKKLAKNILARIRREGPLRSKDFESPKRRKAGGWWEWKPAKRALEYLFLSGELMVSHRKSFQKVYDLPENVIPKDIDTSTPDLQEWSNFIVRSMINALGVANEYDIAYAKNTIRRLAKVAISELIKESITRLCDEGELTKIWIEGQLYYSRPSTLELLPLRAAKREVKLLSPFDNLVINRRRTLELFDFDYQIECYLPAHKRIYGYFSLPILYGAALIGRADAKVHRKSSELEVKSLFLETEIEDQVVGALKRGLKGFAHQLGCHRTIIVQTEPRSLKQLLTPSD